MISGRKMPVSLKEHARMLNWMCKESSYDMREWVSMFVIVVYDVGSKRVSKIMKTCRKYLSHKQKSVFEGMITEAQLKKLKWELESKLEKTEDAVCIYKIQSLKYTSKEEIGKSCISDNLI